MEKKKSNRYRHVSSCSFSFDFILWNYFTILVPTALLVSSNLSGIVSPVVILHASELLELVG